MPAAVIALGLAACGGGGGGSDGDGSAGHTLTVQRLGGGSGTVTGGGIGCGTTCIVSLAVGTAVTLTATADGGSTFAGWSGCDSAAETTCNVTMSADRTVIATFDAGAGSLEVVNGTGSTVREIYVSPAGADAWGANRLTAPILPAGAFTLADLPAGTYDFRAVAVDGISYWQANSASITVGGVFTWTLQPPDVGSLSMVNFHCIAIDELRVRPSSSPAWSENQLAAPVAAGGTFALGGLPVGTYDVSARALDGNSFTVYAIPVTAGGAYTWSVYMPAGTGCLTLVNNLDTGSTIRLLYVAPSPSGCRDSAWGTELLAGQTIPPDASFTFSNIPQGPHDLWAITSEPNEQYRFCGVSIPGGNTLFWYLAPP